MSARQLVIGTSGIYVSYLVLSVISEKLYSTEYPSIKDPSISQKFHYPCFLVWFSSLLCAIYAYSAGGVTNQPPNPIPRKQQMLLGLLFTVNMLAANYALLYITFLQQSLARNSRYLAVVVVGAFFSRVKKGSSLKLSPKKIIVASVITLGVILFTLFGENKKHGASKNNPADDSWKGYLMLVFSIGADALFSDSQAYAKSQFKPTSNQLFKANFYAFVYVFIFSFIIGQGFEQFHFCINHPTVIIDLLVMSVLQVTGQISIYYVILHFKQHMFPLISTTRKVFTVLLSILIFGHSLSLVQWLSIALVFGGLAYELNEQLHAKKDKHKNQKQDVQKPKQIQQSTRNKQNNQAIKQQNKVDSSEITNKQLDSNNKVKTG